jgi:hypothetical protein
MEQRIELYEKYVSNSDEEIDQYEAMGLTLKPTYNYRRIYPLVSDICYIREIEDNKQETIVVFKSMIEHKEGHSIIVLGNYDELCIKLNDLENSILEDDE